MVSRLNTFTSKIKYPSIRLNKRSITPSTIYSESSSSIRLNRFYKLDYSKELFKLSMNIRDYNGINHPLDLVLPKYEENKSFNYKEIEESGMSWASEKKIYKDKFINVLKDTYVSLLISVCYPYLSKEDAVLMDKWIRFLFAIDDWVDDSDYSKFDINKIVQSNKRKKEVALTIFYNELINPVRITDTHLTIAMSELLYEFKNVFDSRGIDNREFIDTFFLYLDSLVLEKQYQQESNNFHLTTKERIREDSTGSIHVVSCGSILMNCDIKTLNSDNYTLIKMRECVAKCISYSNDIFSFNKEMINVEKNRSDIKIDQIYRNRVISPPILNQISDSKVINFSEIFKLCCEYHNRILIDFYDMKSFLLKEENKDVIKYIDHIEKWLNQPYWAISIPRYNIGTNSINYSFLDSFKNNGNCNIFN